MKQNRWLLLHSESDCLFECTDEKEYNGAMEEFYDDVTGVEFFEKQFLKEKIENKIEALKSKSL